MAINILKSKLGRNTFILSSSIAALPLIAVGLISLAQVNGIFDARNRDYLDESARAYGRIVYERLLLASESLLKMEPGESRGAENRQINGVAYISANGVITDANIDLSPQLLSAASTAQQVTLRIESGDQRMETYVIQPTTDGSVVGRISIDYLWGDQDEFPYRVDYCVTASGSDQPAFCSGNLSPNVFETVRDSDSSTGLVEWSSGDAPMNSAFWELFSRSYFDGPVLRFIATQPAEVGLAQWTTFLAIYAPVLVITIGLVLLASSAHVRRILGPINVLLSATKRFSQGELSARAEVERSDEFADLANAMNSMADELRTDIDALNRLSEIDQIILGGTEIDEIADLVLMQLIDTDSIACAAIAILDRSHGASSVWHCRGTGDDKTKIVRLGLDENTRDALTGSTQAFPLDEIENVRIHRLFSAYGVSGVFVIPVRVRDRCEAVLVLGGDFFGEISQESFHRPRDLAGRLAVALESHRREDELVRQATIDSLTGLPNRELCRDRLEQALIRARNGQHSLSLAFIDLDRFKHVNDSLGHSSGDELLRQAANRLVSCVGDTDTVARLGGDEFVVIIPQPTGSRSTDRITAQILQALSEPFKVGPNQIFISASIGTVTYPRDGDTEETLLRKADLAMYGAKEAGRDQAHAFTTVMEDRVCARVSLETDLRQALDRNELSLAYQPQIQLATDQCIAAEALLRWYHPTRGVVSPADFVPLAEETGYIGILGAWVMSTACRQFKQWQHDGLPIKRIAVNVSAEQFGQPDFASQVQDCIENAGILPEYLELEVTEGVFVGDLPKAVAVLERLKSLGVSVAIDDFGTGYSSLSYLRDLPFDIVKIDRAFIKDIPHSREACAIVNAVAAMTHTLEKEVVAEGIETESQRDYLRKLGVELGQGFLLAKPLAASDFAAWFGVSSPRGIRAVSGL